MLRSVRLIRIIVVLRHVLGCLDMQFHAQRHVVGAQNGTQCLEARPKHGTQCSEARRGVLRVTLPCSEWHFQRSSDQIRSSDQKIKTSLLSQKLKIPTRFIPRIEQAPDLVEETERVHATARALVDTDRLDGLANSDALTRFDGRTPEDKGRGEQDGLDGVGGGDALEHGDAVVDGLDDALVRCPVGAAQRIDGVPEVDPHHLLVQQAGQRAAVGRGGVGRPIANPGVNNGGVVEGTVVDDGIHTAVPVGANRVADGRDLRHVVKGTIRDANEIGHGGQRDHRSPVHCRHGRGHLLRGQAHQLIQGQVIVEDFAHKVEQRTRGGRAMVHQRLVCLQMQTVLARGMRIHQRLEQETEHLGERRGNGDLVGRLIGNAQVQMLQRFLAVEARSFAQALAGDGQWELVLGEVRVEMPARQGEQGMHEAEMLEGHREQQMGKDIMLDLLDGEEGAQGGKVFKEDLIFGRLEAMDDGFEFDVGEALAAMCCDYKPGLSTTVILDVEYLRRRALCHSSSASWWDILHRQTSSFRS